MTIKTLKKIPLETLTEVFNLAFSDYAIKIEHRPESKKHRLERSRVNLDLSIGAFDNDQLIAFMLTGVGQWKGHQTVYNAGTGVIPGFRGRRLVKSMYDFAIPLWKKVGFTQMSLEVLVDNTFAIKAYESVGMEKTHRLISYHGSLPEKKLDSVFNFVKKDKLDWHQYEGLKTFDYSWDFCQDGVNAVNDIYQTYELRDREHQLQGFAIVNNQNQIAQAGVKTPRNWPRLLTALGQYYDQLKWINIHESQISLMETLENIGWKKIVEQFEMRTQI